MAKVEMPYVQLVKKENGRRYYYFRRPGYQSIRLPGAPGFPEFMRAYEAAMQARRNEIGADRTAPGTMKALAVSWCGSSRFRKLQPGTQSNYRRHLDEFLETYGTKMVATLQPHHLVRILESMSATPSKPNQLLKILRGMMQFAFEQGWRPDNPVRDVKRIRYRKTPFQTWSEEHIAAFEARWPVGTRARLAFALLLYTGQRRGDVIRMGPQHVKDDFIEVMQQKTGTHLAIPVHPDLRAAIDAHGCDHLAFLVTGAGRPFSTGTGFYNWFRECSREAGVPDGLSPHGLRKAAARRLAEAGCTAHQIMSITGHQTLAEVERYTREANKKSLASAAIIGLGRPKREQNREND